MSNKVYDILKWIALVCIPAMAFLYSTLAGVWNLPYGDEIPKTLFALETFLGALLGISTINYNKTQAQLKQDEMEDEEIEEDDEYGLD